MNTKLVDRACNFMLLFAVLGMCSITILHRFDSGFLFWIGVLLGIISLWGIIISFAVGAEEAELFKPSKD